MQTKLVIFDLDGTLLDTRDDLGNACNHALKTLGHPTHPLGAYNLMVGRGIRNLFRAALPPDKVTEEELDRMTGVFVPFYNTHIADFTRPYPGIPEMMDRLAAAGIRSAVASNKYQEGAELLMEKFFPRIRFVRILGQREGHPIKPDPEIVFQCMAAVPGVGKEHVVYAGDSDVDMQTGANAGVRTVGVLWGFRTREELEACRPWRLAPTVQELEKAIFA